jgi:hypothetical protein
MKIIKGCLVVGNDMYDDYVDSELLGGIIKNPKKTLLKMFFKRTCG